MGVTIHPITLGVDHCYLIRGEKIIMIDGGAPKQGKRFMKAIERLGNHFRLTSFERHCCGGMQIAGKGRPTLRLLPIYLKKNDGFDGDLW